MDLDLVLDLDLDLDLVLDLDLDPDLDLDLVLDLDFLSCRFYCRVALISGGPGYRYQWTCAWDHVDRVPYGSGPIRHFTY